MRFTVSSKPLPWRARLAVLFGARVVSGVYMTPERRLVITLGVRWGRHGKYIWWQEWTASEAQSQTFIEMGKP